MNLIFRTTTYSVIFTAIITFDSGCSKFHHVDPKPAVDLAEAFYADLQRNDAKSAYAKYGEDFRKTNGKIWETFLDGLQSQSEPLISIELLQTKIIPYEGTGCTAVIHKVKRRTLLSQETLLICPLQSLTSQIIIGHEIIRLDTQKKIVAGVGHREVGQ